MIFFRIFGAVLLLLCCLDARSQSVQTSSSDLLIQLGKQVQLRVEKLRGLKAKKPMRWEMTTREQVRTYLIQTLEQQYAPGEMEREGLALEALGLVPKQMRYKKYLLDLLQEQIGGYYDPKTEVFYLAQWIAPMMQETILAHELTHALQDQYFDIDSFVDRERGNADAMLARSSLVEGEATLVMMLDSMRSSGFPIDLSMLDLDGTLGQMMTSLSMLSMPHFQKAPRIVRDMLMFPYLKGLSFVAYAKKRHGWRGVDKIYSKLPVSTEQVIHPNKYYADDKPTPVDLSLGQVLVPNGYQQIYEDVLGEFGSAQLLDALGDREVEKKAAAGWDGDRYRVYKKGNDLAWLSLSTWDRTSDAVEFAAAFSKTVPSRHPQAKLEALGEQPKMVYRLDNSRVLMIWRTGQWVLIMDGYERPQTQAVCDAVAKRLKKSKSTPR